MLKWYNLHGRIILLPLVRCDYADFSDVWAINAEIFSNLRLLNKIQFFSLNCTSIYFFFTIRLVFEFFLKYEIFSNVHAINFFPRIKWEFVSEISQKILNLVNSNLKNILTWIHFSKLAVRSLQLRRWQNQIHWKGLMRPRYSKDILFLPLL